VTDKELLDSCKKLNAIKYVFKQNQPLLSSDLHENVGLNCCNPEEVSPPICDKRVVEISNSVWTQLANNEWVYFVPSSESVTILSMYKPPIDVIVPEFGKLWISTSCKSYGKLALIQTHSIVDVDNPANESDFMFRVHLEYDCCE
jgi:hypothetical protein